MHQVVRLFYSNYRESIDTVHAILQMFDDQQRYYLRVALACVIRWYCPADHTVGDMIVLASMMDQVMRDLVGPDFASCEQMFKAIKTAREWYDNNKEIFDLVPQQWGAYENPEVIYFATSRYANASDEPTPETDAVKDSMKIMDNSSFRKTVIDKLITDDELTYSQRQRLLDLGFQLPLVTPKFANTFCPPSLQPPPIAPAVADTDMQILTSSGRVVSPAELEYIQAIKDKHASIRETFADALGMFKDSLKSNSMDHNARMRIRQNFKKRFDLPADDDLDSLIGPDSDYHSESDGFGSVNSTPPPSPTIKQPAEDLTMPNVTLPTDAAAARDAMEVEAALKTPPNSPTMSAQAPSSSASPPLPGNREMLD